MKKNITINVSDIIWDDAEGVNLPSSLKVSVPTSILSDTVTEAYSQTIDDYVSDEISNITGFCHEGFVMDIDNNISLLEKKLTSNNKKEDKKKMRTI